MNDDRETLRLLLPRPPRPLRVIAGDGLLPAFRQQPWAAVLIAGDVSSTFMSQPVFGRRKVQAPREEEWF